jgi:hypothetical protein
MSAEDHWGFTEVHFNNLIEPSRLHMLILTTNAMIKYCRFLYYHIMEICGIEEEVLQKAQLLSKNLPIFESSLEQSAYAWTPNIQNPKTIFLNQKLIDQLNRSNDKLETIRIIFLFSTVICHEMAHVLIRLKSSGISPSAMSREGHSGYFIENILNRGKVSQVTDGHAKCIGLVYRRLRDYNEEKPDYVLEFNDGVLLKWFDQVSTTGLHHQIDLKNLKKFSISELKPGQFIEDFEDTPDFPEFFSSNLHQGYPGEDRQETWGGMLHIV